MIERLPERLAIDILSKAYLSSQPEEGPLVWNEYGGVNPLRTVAPLVCRDWNRIICSPAASRVFFKRVRIVDACIQPKRRFQPAAMMRWFRCKAQPYVQELEVDLSSVFSTPPLLERVSLLLADLVAAAPALHVLHLTGELKLGRLFERLGPRLAGMRTLRSVHLARGGADDWGVAAGVEALAAAPALSQLQIIFRSDVECAPAELPASIAALTGLRHLALTWPTRSALPPANPLPEGLGALTQLVTLQLRRMPAATLPGWLGRLTRLRHLYWDLCLPTDIPATAPPGLELLRNLRTLYIDLAPPLAVPSTLDELRTLVVVSMAPPGAPEQDWDWLAAFTRLRSLRIQGSGMRAVPDAVRDLPSLTRLSLNNNRLSSLPDGPWVSRLLSLHLGSNCFTSFPPALHGARALTSLHLANQRGEGAVPGLPRSAPRLVLHLDDVTALCALPALRLVVLAQAQPWVQAAQQDAGQGFSWLQRTLAEARVRLTSNELAFKLEQLPMFNTPHVGWGLNPPVANTL